MVGVNAGLILLHTSRRSPVNWRHPWNP